jgi:hypothetical protein
VSVDVSPRISRSRVPSYKQGAGRPWRMLATVTTLALTLPFALDAQRALEQSAFDYSQHVEWQSRLLIFVPLVALVLTAAARTFHIAIAVYWTWSFVFLGLAPAIQLARQSFPWTGTFSVEVIEEAQSLVLLGHVSFAILAWFMSRRGSAVPPGPAEPHEPKRTDDTKTKAYVRVLAGLGLTYLVVATMFVALMGSALFRARAVFRIRVLEIAALPLGGFLYFAVTAGAIVIPSALIICRRHGVPVPVWLVGATWLSAALVTNPLVGSRFLSGSFIVATAVALLHERRLLRLVPVGSVVLLIVLFPSMDVLRGDATGSVSIQILSFEDSMLDYDFDAFEMGAREVSLTTEARASLPSSSHMLLAPLARWIPILSRPYIGDSGGKVVAEATGMEYTNVSMPLWAEGDLIAGAAGTIVVLGALGAWLGVTRRQLGRGSPVPQLASLPGTTALLFIVLRGSIYEVLGYLALAVIVYYLLVRGGSVKDHA